MKPNYSKELKLKTFSPVEIKAACITKYVIKKYKIHVDSKKKSKSPKNIKFLRECCGGGPGAVIDP